MAGHLTITEYPYKGEVTASTPKEPPTRVQRVPIGEVSAELHSDTFMVALYSSLPCEFAFFTGNDVPTEGTPMTENYEIIRMVHPNSRLRIAALEQVF